MRKVLMGMMMLVAVACTGVTAREEVLMRDMALVWPNVAADVQRGSTEDVSAQIQLVTNALQTADRYELARTPVMSLLDLASIGIQKRVESKEIGAGVAKSLLERVRNFRESFLLTVAR